MKIKIQILALSILLATGHGIHAAWAGYNNPHNQMFEDNDQLQFRDDSFLESIKDQKKKKYGNSGYSFQEYINRKDKDGRTFLLLAILYSQGKKAKRLIELGAEVNSQSPHGDTPLHYAVNLLSGYKLTQLLLAAGAHVNRKNICGDTPLHLASQFKHNGVIQLLLDAGVDTEIKNNDGYTAEESIINNDIMIIYRTK